MGQAHIGVFYQLFEYLDSCLTLEVESDTPFVGVEVDKKAAFLRVRVVLEERTQALRWTPLVRQDRDRIK